MGKLTIFYTNIDVLTKSKLNLLEVRISLMSPDIICITEILPKNTKSKYSIDTYQLKGYNIITYNFQKRGICIYAKPNLNISVLEFVYDFEECVWCKIMGKQDTFVLGCCYRSPSSHEINDTKLFSMLSNILSIYHKNMIVFGDFNYPDINWEIKSLAGISVSSALFLNQLVSEPTRYRHGQKSNLLDLVLTNNSYIVNDILIEDPVGKSDHATIIVNLDVEVYEDGHIERRLYYKGDYKGMRDYFTAINWSILLAHKSVQETWDIFVKHFTYAINRYIPITTKPILGNTKSWIDHNVKSHIKSKRKSFNKYYRNPTEENWKAYTIERNISTTASDNARVRFENNICKDSKQNPKTFWQYVNSKHKKVNKLVSLRDSSEILHYDDLSKANLLNKYFSSVFTKNQYTDDVINNDIGICIGSFYFNENHIKILIEKLNICKDGIHAKVIKECSCIFFPYI